MEQHSIGECWHWHPFFTHRKSQVWTLQDLPDRQCEESSSYKVKPSKQNDYVMYADDLDIEHYLTKEDNAIQEKSVIAIDNTTLMEVEK